MAEQLRLYDTSLFASRLKSRRKERALSQSNLATFVGVDPSYISLMEGGFREPSFEVLARLAEILQVSTDYLIGVKSIELLDARRQMEMGEAVALLPTPTGPNGRIRFRRRTKQEPA